jgi:hypothetical protein
MRRKAKKAFLSRTVPLPVDCRNSPLGFSRNARLDCLNSPRGDCSSHRFVFSVPQTHSLLPISTTIMSDSYSADDEVSIDIVTDKVCTYALPSSFLLSEFL